MMSNNLLKIITTVGTSLLGNYHKTLKDGDISKFKTFTGGLEWLKYDDKKNEPHRKDGRKSFSENEWKKVVAEQSKDTSWSKKIIDAAENGKIDAAELKSIDAIVGEQDKKTIEIHLLTSYTLDGYLCGWLLKQILEKKGYSCVKLEKIKDLTIDNSDNFQQSAINNLTDYITKNSNETTVLNITGGYKALIPFITILGQLKKIDLKYIYEDSNELITISGKLPFHFDTEIIQSILQYLTDKWIDISTINTEAYDYLVKTDLIMVNKAETQYKSNIMGNFIRKFMIDQAEQPTSKGILGLFVETKMYEYFNENELYAKPRKFKFKNKWFINEKTAEYQLYNEVELRNQFSIPKDRGIDKELRKEMDAAHNVAIVPVEDVDLTVWIDGKFALCEVKAFDQVKQNYLKRIQGRVDAYLGESEQKIDTFIFIVYRIKFLHESEQHKASADNGLKEKLKYFKDHLLKVEFKALYFEVDLREKALMVNYTNLLRNDISVKSIDL